MHYTVVEPKESTIYNLKQLRIRTKRKQEKKEKKGENAANLDEEEISFTMLDSMADVPNYSHFYPK